MRQALIIFQIVVSILLIVSIVIQEKGVGLGMGFGGGGELYRSKRGLDRILFVITVILAILFIGSAVAFIFIK